MKNSEKNELNEMEDDILDLSPRELFDRIGNDWHFWLLQTDALLSASESLNSSCGNPPNPPDDPWDYLKIHMVVKMLRGMALECLLKAIWLKTGGTLTNKGKYQTILGTRDHDLYSLAIKVSENTGLNLTIEDLKILSRLSFAITSGRYPIEKSVTGRPSTPKMDESIKWNKWAVPKDDELFESIVYKLMSPFERE